ncbi:MAG: FIST C-terminal domain-containing protein [Nanoarchaeota archaeon]|nr:FIST C-terminal domain-containing protein [Nanoarchaeota archaeon]
MNMFVGVGTSRNENSFEAGKGAVKESLTALKGEKADILIVFASPRFKHAELLKGIQSVTGNVPMVGGTTAGEVSNNGFEEGSVVIMAIHSDKIKFKAGIGQNVHKDAKKAGIALVEDLEKRTADFAQAKTLLMFNDPLAGDGLEIIRGIQEKVGEDFEIVGGALGDGNDFKKIYQYYNGKAYTDSVVGLLVSGRDIDTVTGMGSGWKSIGNRFRCTKAEGAVVQSFDNTPALDIYEAFLGKEKSQKLPAIGLEYPFGIIDEKAKVGNKEYIQVRCPLAVDRKKKTITLAAAIPQGKDVTLTVSSRQEVIDSAKSVAKMVKKDLKGSNPELIMMFSCVASKMVLGPRAPEEVEAVRGVLGKDIPIIGFYTYGEIGPIDKKKKELKQTRWHNETVVLWALSKKIK